MPRDEFSEMRAFLEVARERSFTRAAAKLGVTARRCKDVDEGR
jgi:hypothetical protein